jgi:GTP cyclohydrolase FolE2
VNGEELSSINAVGKTGCPHAKERSWTLISHYMKSNSKQIEDLSIRPHSKKGLDKCKKCYGAIYSYVFSNEKENGPTRLLPNKSFLAV